MNGATNPPDAASTCTGMSRPVCSWNSSSAPQISSIGSYDAVERRAQDPDHADRVLVAPFDRLLGRERVAVALHRHQPHLDVPVVDELLPADLDVDPHHQVGLVDRLALGRSPLLPQPLHRQAAEHRGLARPGGRASGRLLGVGRVPEPAEDVHAAHLELRRLRVLVLVDHVLVEALRHQLPCLGLHPGGHERGQVEPGVAVQHQLVGDHLVGEVRRHLAGRDVVAGDRLTLEGEQRGRGQIVRWAGRALGVLQRHGRDLLWHGEWDAGAGRLWRSLHSRCRSAVIPSG